MKVLFPISVLDLAVVRSGEPVSESLKNSVALAQHVEALGYTRLWYAEHHNMPTIASSATSVLIAHVAANTDTIRVGSGGVMLPNHAPLMIAEQFGTLETLHPGRIDLGLGRAPGTDQVTLRALRRDPMAAETFPQDVVELQGYLSNETRVVGVEATPGKGTFVPLYILGSSLFGAQLAAMLGLPYAFASHFAPEALTQAVDIYRREFRPSQQLGEPYVIAALNVIASETQEEADEQFLRAKRSRVKRFLAPGREFSDEEADALLNSVQGQQVLGMMKHFAVGTGEVVRAYMDDFADFARADELMVVFGSGSIKSRLTSATILAQAMGLPPR